MIAVGEVFLLIFTIFIVSIRIIGSLKALAFVGIIIVGYSCHLYNGKQYWIRQNVRGPKPSLFFGNAQEFQNGLHTLDKKWSAEFGETYGSFLFGVPELTSSNMNILRTVLVKKFDHFQDHVNLLNVDPDDPTSLLANSLVSLKGPTWSQVRATVAPGFSTARIKQMIPTFNNCGNICSKILSDYSRKKRRVPIYDVMMRLMLDMTTKAAFGRDYDVQHDAKSEFIKLCQKYVEFDFRSVGLVLVSLFPNLCHLWKVVTGRAIIKDETNRYFYELLQYLVEDRTKNNEKFEYQDHFQLLLESLHTSEDNGKLGLRNEHILGQAFMFILAGFETGPIALHLTVYMLAIHGECQEECREEIRRVCGDTDPDYSQLSRLPYLDQCINETMRLFPSVVRVNRVCTKPTTVEGIRFEKSCVFSVPIWKIHHSEEYYENPEEFLPERWTTEEKAKRDVLSFLPFGHGPRGCIGMRVGQFQLRCALVHLLRRYRFRPSAGSPTELPLEIDTRGSMRTVEKLFVDVEEL